MTGQSQLARGQLQGVMEVAESNPIFGCDGRCLLEKYAENWSFKSILEGSYQ
jgi:hypothetical protein